jgi:hypothetical protein
MAFTNAVSGQGKWAVLAVAATAAALLAFSACGGSSSASAGTAAVGVPPPEWTANAGGWPANNYDLANTRATTQTSISTETVSQLTPKWRFALKGASTFGVFASSPIVLGGTVYLQDLSSQHTDRGGGRHVGSLPHARQVRPGRRSMTPARPTAICFSISAEPAASIGANS